MLHIQTVGTPGNMNIDFSFLYNKGKTLFVTQRSSHPEVFLGKVALQVKATLLKSHFGMDVPLQICCIFSEHFFLGTPLVDCFWAQKFFFPSGKYMFKVNNRNTRTRCEIYS